MAAMAAVAKQRRADAMVKAERGLKLAFDAIDTDHGGTLDQQEILTALSRIMGFSMDTVHTERPDIVKRVDAACEDLKTIERLKASGKSFNPGDLDFIAFKQTIGIIMGIEEEEEGDNREEADAPATPAVPSKWDQIVGFPRQEVVQRVYSQPFCQLAVAAVIVFNFFAIVLENEIDPYTVASGHKRYQTTVWQTIDDFCNYVFLVELLVNLYGNFWRPFVVNPWNYLDTVVVIVGVVSLLRVPLGQFAKIKILRAFRILRLFKRVESLNKILVALLGSIPGVINALVVLFIFLLIYAIVAVDLFRDFGADGPTFNTSQTFGPADARWGPGADYTNFFVAPGAGAGLYSHERFDRLSVNTALTARGFHYGQEYYGTVSRSLFTLFQVLTGESWAEAVVRPLLFGWDTGNALVVSIFFTSFVLMTSIILLNVVVAVLLDKFLEPSNKAGAEEELAKELRAAESAEKLVEMLKQASPSHSTSVRSYARTVVDDLLAENAKLKKLLSRALQTTAEDLVVVDTYRKNNFSSRAASASGSSYGAERQVV
jgi:hypothetical protein